MIHIDYSNFPFIPTTKISVPNNSTYGYVNPHRPYNEVDVKGFHNPRWNLRYVDSRYNFYLDQSIRTYNIT